MTVSAFFALAAMGAQPPAQTTPLRFVQTYISQLAIFESVREEGSQDTNKANGDGTKASLACIHSNTRYDLEVGSAIRTLDGMHLKANFKEEGLESVPHDIADIYRMRQKIMREMLSICSAFVEGPKPGVDYGALIAKMPELRARLEYLDQTEFPAAALAFATLISDRPDKQGHASHLIISCAEKDGLLSQIKDSFGSELDTKDASSGVVRARFIRDKLIEYKCAEEPR